MDLNLVILSLEYSYLINSLVGLFESNIGLWQDQSDFSHSLIPYTILNQHAKHNSFRVMDNMASLRDVVMSLNHNGLNNASHVKLIEPQLKNQLITVSICGPETFVNNSRTEILKHYHHVDYKRIPLSAEDFSRITPDFVHRLEQCAAKYNVEFIINNVDSDFHDEAKHSDGVSIYIAGARDNLAVAETKCRILIDVLLHGNLLDRVQVPLSLMPCLGGVDFSNFDEISRQANVTMYLPSLLPQVFNSHIIETNDNMNIWLTSSQPSEIILAKQILDDLVRSVNPQFDEKAVLFTQEVPIVKEKLDIITLYQQKEIVQTMLRHGTFIQLPTLGEANNDRILVQGHNEEAVAETAFDLSNMTCDFYNLDMKFLQGSESADFEYFLINLINLKKTCVLTYNGNGMNIVGNKQEIHDLIEDLVSGLQKGLPFGDMVSTKDSNFQLLVHMELNNRHRDFLSGKKNGKITKILNQLGHIPQIKFSSLNEYNFEVITSIDVANKIRNTQFISVFDLLLKSMSLIEMELPAEMQFNIPEVFHKSIIGNGGSIIQSIMKKYNVFIKFSNSKKPGESDEDRILYSFRRDNNVLIKCPMKNLKNILFVKYEIDQLVAQCCLNTLARQHGTTTIYNSVGFRLLKSHYLMLIRAQQHNVRFVNDLEIEYGVFIDFPTSLKCFKDNNEVMMAIKGNESRTYYCAKKLELMLPQTSEVQVTFCQDRFEAAISDKNQEFRDKILIPFRLLLQVELSWKLRCVDPETQEVQPFHEITLSSYDEKKMQTAMEELSQFLREKRFLILDKQAKEFDPIVEQTLVPVTPSATPLRTPLGTPIFGRSPMSSPLRSPTRSPTRSPARSPMRSPTGRATKQPLKSITNQPINNLKKIPDLGAPVSFARLA